MDDNKLDTTKAINEKGLWDYKKDEWEVMTCDIDSIKGVSKFNVRKEDPSSDLPELIVSLKEIGINTTPIILDENDEVISGQRRYLAAKRAGIKKLLCIKKEMTDKEKNIRSFVENELQRTLSDKDKFMFAKALKEQGMSNTEIGYAVGRSLSTIGRWLLFDNVPETLKDTPGEKAFKESSHRAKTVTYHVIEKTSMRGDVEASIELAKAAKGMRRTQVDKIAKDLSTGALGTYTKEQIEQHIANDKAVRTNPNSFNKYDLFFPMDLWNDIIQVKKTVYPKVSVENVIFNALYEWVKVKQKEAGLMR